MKLVTSLHCRGSRVERLTYYREKVEQVLPSLVSDLLRVEAKWRSHDGLSMDKGEISMRRRTNTPVATPTSKTTWPAPSLEEHVEGS